MHTKKLVFALALLCITSYITLAQYHLPVEVLGEEGKVVVTQIDLDATTANSAQRLWLQVNNLGYDDKASIRINDGTWYSLSNNSVDMANAESSRGGMVYGGFNTIRFSIPASNWTEGTNIIRYRFNESDGISMGYRVIKLNLLDASGEKLLSDSDFSQEDPLTWEGPYTDQASIDEGEDLWRNGQLWANYLEPGRTGSWYAYELIGDNTTQIKATCADCHTQDGRDLEYFAYSNESITERAKFHGMSEHEGELITSYIRSLSDQPDIERLGRPWNPPYQPGKELMGKTIEHWAAGAGLDAVLEEDAEMKDHLFPDGVSQETLNEYFDSDDIENVTETPVAIQMPDWKHWLPLIHPKDAYTKNGFYEDPSVEYNPQRAYEAMRDFFESDDINDLPKNQIKQKIRDFWNHNRQFFVQGASTKKHWRSPDGDATKALANNVPREMAAMSLAKLMAVKYFEIYNDFDLQDKASWFAPASDQPSDRQWPASHYQVFEVPPHFQACVKAEGSDGACNAFVGQPLETGKFESTAWYHLQAVINPGMGMLSSTAPVDWNYHPRHILDASYTSDVEEPLRYFQSINLMYQTRTGWSGDTGPNSEGFRMRNMGPWVSYGWDGNNRTGGYENGVFPLFLDDIEPGMSKWVINAQLDQFLYEMDKPINNLDDWGRTAVDDWSSESIPTADIRFSDLDMNAVETRNPFGHYVEKTYYVIPEYAKMGVDCEILDDLIDWADEAWPRINWDQFKGLAEPQVVLANVSGCDNGIEARVANTGNNPTFVWEVNGTEVDDTDWTLDPTYYTGGDVVSVRVNGVASCATKTGPTEDQITVTGSEPCNQVVPVDSAYYDFSDADFTSGITDQWSDNHLTNNGATRIVDASSQAVASFDGTDDVINTDIGLLETNSANLTVEAWVNINTNLGATQRIITLDPAGAFFFRINGAGRFQLVINSDVNGTNTRQTENSTASIPADTWTHLAAVMSPTSVKFYIDGQLDSEQPLDAPFDYAGAGSDLFISIGGTGATPDGMIDEVKIYNRLLSASEINTSYNSYSVISGGTEIANNMEMAIYPNPASDILNVELFHHGSESLTISLIGVDGKRVLSQEVNGSGSNTIQLDLGVLNITQGTYFLQVEGENSSVTHTVIINQSKN